jgi:hypothetical protein
MDDDIVIVLSEILLNSSLVGKIEIATGDTHPVRTMKYVFTNKSTST